MLRGPIPGTVVVWSCNQVARVPCSVVEKQKKAKETPSRPSSPSSEQSVPGVAETYREGMGVEELHSGLESQLWGRCLEGNETGFWGSPFPWGCGSFL